MASKQHRYRVTGPNPFRGTPTGGTVTLPEDGPINLAAAANMAGPAASASEG